MGGGWTRARAVAGAESLLTHIRETQQRRHESPFKLTQNPFGAKHRRVLPNGERSLILSMMRGMFIIIIPSTMITLTHLHLHLHNT